MPIESPCRSRIREPRLTDEDRAIWETWCRTALVHVRTELHRRRVERALRTVSEMRERCPNAYVAWSAGKDSTALVHLVCVGAGMPARAMSIKDDLDFPGEEQYVRELAGQWGVEIDVERPPESLAAWVARQTDLLPGEDIHGRRAGLSRWAFYAPIEQYAQERGYPGVYLGLRSEESDSRARNRASHGLIYRQGDRQTVCQPLADWRAEDVYGYLLARDIPLLDVYRCVRLADHPGRVRKSWWLPGAETRHGYGMWLRIYYPSLWRRACELLPGLDRVS